MGGRGAGLETVSPGGGGGGSEGEWSNAPNVKQPESLKEALGTKGRAMGIAEAARGANPYYSSSYREFSENCQRAVIAYEARRRGYNVTAQPTFEGDNLGTTAYSNKTRQYKRYTGAFQHAKTERISGKNSREFNRSIEKKLDSFGGDSRSILSVSWKGKNYGHALIVERKGKNTYFIDPQVGKKYTATGLLSKVSSVSLTRVDNLRLSNRAMKSVEQAGTRTNGKRGKK